MRMEMAPTKLVPQTRCTAHIEAVDVLVIAPLTDVHGIVVSRHIEALGMKVLVVDTADYLRCWRLTATLNGGAPQMLIRSFESGRVFDVSSLRGVWYRRLWPFRISERILDKDVQSFAYNECRDFIHGVLATYPNIINDPAREWAANRKVLQLQVASRVGLRIPRTLVSTDPHEVRAFEEQNNGDIIFKCLTNTAFQFTETRRLEPAHWERSGAMCLAPTIFEERIAAQHHLRATYVDGDIFTARLTTRQAFAQDDWRLDPSRDVAASNLDADTTLRVKELMRLLGLRYGAIDFIVDNEAMPCFLEVNPSGQFLFSEIHAELPISKAIALALTGARPESVVSQSLPY
jgi:hypothetical protein